MDTATPPLSPTTACPSIIEARPQGTLPEPHGPGPKLLPQGSMPLLWRDLPNKLPPLLQIPSNLKARAQGTTTPSGQLKIGATTDFSPLPSKGRPQARPHPKPATDWKDRVCGDSRGGLKLSFKPNTYLDGSINIPLSAVQKDIEACKAMLVGYFLGKRLAFSYVKTVAFQMWGFLGDKEARANDSGLWFFTFSSEDDIASILDQGP